MSKTVALTAQSAHSPISVNASDMTQHSPISVNGSDKTRHSPNSPISVNGSDTTQSQHDLSTRPSHDPQERWSRRKGEVNYYGGRQLRRARMSGLSHSRSHEEILHRKLWDIVNSRRKRQLVDETVELMSTGRGPYNSHKPSCPKVKVVPPHFNSDITAALRFPNYKQCQSVAAISYTSASCLGQPFHITCIPHHSWGPPIFKFDYYM
uniref:Uncharacterized protein n=1 Tax=Timema poppense TaxID=170557 RepID=A0A7R9DMI6_TIMPO|nr:unnamed protein product [Timema poppensis]